MESQQGPIATARNFTIRPGGVDKKGVSGFDLAPPYQPPPPPTGGTGTGGGRSGIHLRDAARAFGAPCRPRRAPRTGERGGMRRGPRSAPSPGGIRTSCGNKNLAPSQAGDGSVHTPPSPPEKKPKPPQKKTKKNAAGLMVGRACQHLVLKNTLKLGGKKEKRRFFRRCPMLVEVTARTWEPSSSVAPPRVHRRPPRRGKGRTKRSLALHGVSARGPPGNARQPTTCSSRRARRWQAARRRELGRTGSERRSRGKKRARGCRSPGRLSAPAGGDARRRGAHRQHPHLGRDGQT